MGSWPARASRRTLNSVFAIGTDLCIGHMGFLNCVFACAGTKHDILEIDRPIQAVRPHDEACVRHCLGWSLFMRSTRSCDGVLLAMSWL